MARVKGKSKYDLDFITEGLEQEKTLGPSGKVSFSGSHFEDYESLLLTAIDFRPEVTHGQRHRIIVQSIFEAGKNKIDKNSLIQIIKQKEIDYLRLPRKSFVLISQLSVAGFGPIHRRYFAQGRIDFSRRIPRQYSSEWKEFISQYYYVYDPKLSQDYSWAVTTVDARTEEDAGYKAIECLDLCRAIWNLGFNSSVWRRSSSGRIPVNEVSPGGLHCLLENGRRTDTYWFHTGQGRPIILKDFAREAENLLAFEKSFRRRLAACPDEIRGFIERGLIKYTEIYDLAENQICFQQSWSLLEYFAFFHGNDKYEDMIDRILTMVYPEKRRMFGHILQHLRERRNDLVHYGMSGGKSEKYNDFENLVFQTKWFIERLIFFLLKISSQIKTLSDIKDFMSVSKDLDHARRNLSIWELYLSYQERT